MPDLDNNEQLTASQMIRRAAQGLQTMTHEEKVALMRASEQLDEEIKARFEHHWQRKHAPKSKR